MTTSLPHGSWPTPITADLVVAQSTSLDGLAVDGEVVYWSELRPTEGGRLAVVRLEPGGEPTDVLPREVNARTRVHEYGGAGWWVGDGQVWFVDYADQRLRRLRPGGEPEPFGPEPAEGSSVRWADGHVNPVDGRLAVVRETHPAGSQGAQDVVNELVVLHPDGGPDGEVEVVAGEADFVAHPRWSQDGEALAWLEWDHPAMPWDDARLKVRAGGSDVLVAGGGGEGLAQPTWAADGTLWFCSDRDDDWTLFRWTPAGGAERVLDLPGDVGWPQWVFGVQRFGFLPDGRVVLARMHDGRDRLQVLGPDGVTDVDLDCSYVPTLRVAGDRVVAVVAYADRGTRLLRLDVDDPASAERLDPEHGPDLDPALFPVPRHVEYAGHGGLPTYAQVYLPTNPDVTAPEGELPPVVVTLHGGPTSMSPAVRALSRAFWTSRGFAVADVNYGGSSGYGRAYRDRLQGQWGIVDVADCVAVVEHLGREGLVDPARAVIRGGSAGGFTVLMALATSEVFAAGANLFGVADLEALALHTHKFESRYLDGLVAPYPEGREVYVERSPLTHVDAITAPLVTFQGSEDQVVPPAQSEAIVEAVRAKGLPVAYRLYEGEQHGFRRAENIRDQLYAELSFYAQVLGFELPAEEDVPRLEVENL